MRHCNHLRCFELDTLAYPVQLFRFLGSYHIKSLKLLLDEIMAGPPEISGETSITASGVQLEDSKHLRWLQWRIVWVTGK